MPQSWQAKWPLNDEVKEEFEAEPKHLEQDRTNDTLRDTLIHTLGNLTLMTLSGNTVASNGSFLEKKDWLKQSLLVMNLEIIDHEHWDEKSIIKRSENLAEIVIKIWPGPNK